MRRISTQAMSGATSQSDNTRTIIFAATNQLIEFQLPNGVQLGREKANEASDRRRRHTTPRPILISWELQDDGKVTGEVYLKAECPQGAKVVTSELVYLSSETPDYSIVESRGSRKVMTSQAYLKDKGNSRLPTTYMLDPSSESFCQ
eukprot:541921-Pleurochrysis_carterae.AAC.1